MGENIFLICLPEKGISPWKEFSKHILRDRKTGAKNDSKINVLPQSWIVRGCPYKAAPGFHQPFTKTHFPKTIIQLGLCQGGTQVLQQLLLPAGAFSQPSISRWRAKSQGKKRYLEKSVLLCLTNIQTELWSSRARKVELRLGWGGRARAGSMCCFCHEQKAGISRFIALRFYCAS